MLGSLLSQPPACLLLHRNRRRRGLTLTTPPTCQLPQPPGHPRPRPSSEHPSRPLTPELRSCRPSRPSPVLSSLQNLPSASPIVKEKQSLPGLSTHPHPPPPPFFAPLCRGFLGHLGGPSTDFKPQPSPVFRWPLLGPLAALTAACTLPRVLQTPPVLEAPLGTLAASCPSLLSAAVWAPAPTAAAVTHTSVSPS